jgi:uncharacterized protein (DUF1697 family)
MKTLKFRKTLGDLILSGSKNTTWRLFDDKDLSVGDRVSFVVWETGEPFAEVTLSDVRETTFGKLTPEDWDGHEKFASDAEMYETYSRYYSRPVTADSPVKIIKFRKPSKFVALLRGINVGTARRVNMKTLKALLESLGYANVSTYLNSGNVLFEAEGTATEIRKTVESAIKERFGFEVTTLVKTAEEMAFVAAAIPAEWQNDEEQRTDVAYLFPEVDNEDIVATLPFRREYVDVRYVPGAVFWNTRREHYSQSKLNLIIGHETYRQMTVRNVNTARKL